MSRLSRLWSGGGALSAIMKTSAANLIIVLLGTVTSIVTARMFGVAGKGEFSAILFWSTLLAGVLSFGLPTSLIFNRRTHPAHGPAFIRAGFLFQLPICVVAGTVAWFCMPAWLGNYGDHIVAIARWYTVLTLPLLLAVNLLSALAQSMENFGLYNGIRLYVPLSNLIGLLALWVLGYLSQFSSALMFLVTSLGVVCWALYRLRRELAVGWFGKKDAAAEAGQKPGERGPVKSLFGYGTRVYGVELLGTLYTQCDKLIILSLLAPREFGLYTVVYTLSRVFNIVQTAISGVVFPKVTGLSQEEVVAKVSRAFRLSFPIMLAALVPGMIVGRWLLGLLYGQQFLAADTAFYLLSLECVVGGGSWILASSFNAMGRPGLVVARQAFALALTVGMCFLLAPAYGLNGIALAMLIGAFSRIVISVAAMKVVFKAPVSGVLFDKDDWRFLAGRLTRAAQS
ncbi:lipopolysaccharide biosynthesis protein [Cohnella rhizosphaerae]|uniref:Oligosaccharide flippase family protein n=1 Tax=Cohnella rhizosphaerae TaxID=1457232 RepID=A0A9X4KNV1_9BACL|nr:oligosaccharide flippase family protein [Cohnella rhizosphaerae]MDG0808095.1 oligosaccharide flippase family protein [Cohnella rhizosphaerae]